MTVYWFQDLAIDNDGIIDQQHKQLFILFNELEEAIQAKRGYTALRDMGERLARYCLEHFTAEEALMRAKGFEEVDTHAKEHEGFIEKVMSLEFNPDDPSNHPAEVLDFLRQWLINHIRGRDTRIRPLLVATV